ncbi:LysR family transcriptional regulator [Endozoicomonas montiporae]|uniref:LysR family transcriptional regulator n=1 Tax=Endozoicomonas montiporae CL-33 TaxID=570277 RepID=A0A142B9F4_9GAMM|nr:LysR family transcriptional regulator [Endozoicomonas montiporae]AMO55380.1 LysR family transcriptional regulator [Endozoicomonas montiporae CL-33]
MDIRLLRQFSTVYEEQSISRAAERSFVSQPALSNAIRQLEEELGCLLFSRSKKGVTPTREAEQLYPMALRMIAEIEKIASVLKQQQNREKLSLAIMPELPHQYVAAFLHHIQPLLSEHELLLTQLDQKSPARLILDIMKNDDELFLPIWREEYVLCVHQNNALAKKTTVTVQDLHQQPFIICPPCEAHQRTLSLLSQFDMEVDIVASTASKDQVAMLLLANHGISFLPEGMARQYPEILVKPYTGVSDYRQVGLAWSSLQPPSPLLQKVIERCRSMPVMTR